MEFSGDEFIFFIAASMVSVVGLFRWYLPLVRVSPLAVPLGQRFVLAFAPLVGLSVVLLILQTWADPVYVVGQANYIMLFLAGAGAWIFLSARLFPVLGLSVRDDAMDRNNPAATMAVAGAVLGVSLAYAGSNVGNGPTIWTTLIPAFVATLALGGVWALAELLGGGVTEAVTIDRDLAGGIRLGTLLICAGAVLGRAMAGDWYSWPDTFGEFSLLGWPVLGLVLISAAGSRVLCPTRDRPTPGVVTCGFLPALVMMIATAAYLATLGEPTVAPPGEYPLTYEEYVSQ